MLYNLQPDSFLNIYKYQIEIKQFIAQKIKRRRRKVLLHFLFPSYLFILMKVYNFLIMDPNEVNIVLPEQYEINVTKNLYLLKIDYLNKEKKRLQTEVNELTLNNKLLRKINQQCHNGALVDFRELMKRNEQLESFMLKIFKQIGQLKTELFLTNQINQESEKEQQEMLVKYQQKILELRKLIQVKQASIQNLEESLKEDIAWTPTKMIKIELMEQNQQLKSSLREVNSKYMALITYNDELSFKNKKLQNQIEKYNKLISSKNSFIQFKSLIDDKSSKSQPKARTCIDLKMGSPTKPTRNHIYETTCQDKNLSAAYYRRKQPDFESDYLSPQLSKKILIKKLEEIKKLKQRLKQYDIIVKGYEAEKRKLIQSNEIYQKSRRTITQKSNMYQTFCKVLLSYLTQRKTNQVTNTINFDDNFLRERKVQKVVKKIQKEAQPFFISKQDWISMSNFFEGRRPVKTRQRSFSCIFDYTYNEEREQNAGLQKTVFDDDFSHNFEKSSFAQLDFQIHNFEAMKGQRKTRKAQEKDENIFINVLNDIELQ